MLRIRPLTKQFHALHSAAFPSMVILSTYGRTVYSYEPLCVVSTSYTSYSSFGFGSAKALHSKVRLPVPGMQQMGVMNARLADFERQGVHLDGILVIPWGLNGLESIFEFRTRTLKMLLS